MNHLRIDTVPHHASFSAFNRIRLILLTTLVLFFKLESGRATDLASSFTPAGSVASPDKAVVFELGTLPDGHLAWRVNWQGTQVIAPSRAGILLGENNTGANATVSAPSLRSFVETFSTRHLQKSVSLAGTAAEFPVNIPGGPAWTFEVRLFNQGVAWRMRVPGSGSRHVSGESTDFVLPPATTVYANPETVSYEGLHVKSAIEALQLRNDVGMPMTFELPGARFAALTESHVMHYSGMTLGTTGSNRLIGKFRDDPKGWDMDGDIDSPWRIVLLGENLDALLHASAIVEAVAPPPNPELFPNGSATEWIKPGRSLWQWWAFNDPGTHWSKQKEFVDKAAELKCEYYLVDEGWEHERQEWFKPGNPDGAWETLKELADYAASKGVRLWVWRGWRPDTKKQWVGLETPEKRTEFFRRCREAGVAGVKIDFMESESHERLAFYEACLRAAAKERIMVNFHGANKPTGEARTWPHEMTREAVRGLESNKFGSLPPAHYTTVPFTHLLAGHIDFTPTTLNPAFFKGTTAALQLASAVVFSSPVLSWADDPALYLQSPAVDVIRDMPVEWDETRVLPPSAIGEVVLMARRHGQEWWIAAMNGGTARQFDVNLAALAGKEAVIDIFLEGKKPHEFNITRDAPIPESGLIHLAIKSGSGALIRIKPAAPPRLGSPVYSQPVLTAEAIHRYVEEFNRLDHTHFGQAVSNEDAARWMEDNVPRFDCPDKEMEEIYYFRWWTFRKHIKETPDGFIISEFLPKVSWSGKHNAINCPAAHHYREGRWIREPKYLDDYSVFWFRKGANPRDYSFWAADSIHQCALVLGDFTLAVDLLPELVANYQEWEKSRLCPDGLFWQIDDRDGMEMSIGGNGKRATINSYMYGDARAIAAIARVANKPDIEKEYTAKAEKLRHLVNKMLWDKEALFYKTLPYSKDGDIVSEETKFVDVRELHGFTPWYFHLPEADGGREIAWRQLMDAKGFKAPFGPTTAEQRHPRFAVSYKGHECLWDGPSWPFATAITLTALANVLNDYPQREVSRDDYFETLRTYAKSHRLKQDDGSIVPWIDENLNPFTGDWISRTRLKSWNASGWAPAKGGIERGKDYNHSTFCDLIITGLIGLRPRADDMVEVNPLVPDGTWDFFCLDRVPYHGRMLTILYDRSGKKYGKGAGLRILADGKEIGHSPTLGRVVAPLAKLH